MKMRRRGFLAGVAGAALAPATGCLPLGDDKAKAAPAFRNESPSGFGRTAEALPTQCFRTGRGTGRTTRMLLRVVTAALTLPAGGRIAVYAATGATAWSFARTTLRIAKAAGIDAHAHHARALCFHSPWGGEVHIDFRSVASQPERGVRYDRRFVDHWRGAE